VNGFLPATGSRINLIVVTSKEIDDPHSPYDQWGNPRVKADSHVFSSVREACSPRMGKSAPSMGSGENRGSPILQKERLNVFSVGSPLK